MNPEDKSTFSSRNPDIDDFRAIHDKILPADIRASERIVARIRKRSDENLDSFTDVKVWKLSPLGIELIANSDELSFSKGESVDLEVVIVGQRTQFEGLIVDIVYPRDNVKIYGIRLAQSLPPREGTHERRKSSRWICSDEFLPSAVAPAPGRFDDFMLFKVRNISKDGLQITTSLRNKFLIPGMFLNLSIGFPMGTVVQLQVRIVRTRIGTFGSKDRLVIGVSFENISSLAQRVLGQYLIQFSNVESLDELREGGLTPSSVSRSVSHFYIKAEEDYRKVLRLRFDANRYSKQLGTIRCPEDTGDMNDMRGRILVAKRMDNVIGTARFRFPSLDEPLELESFVKWPKTLPRRDQIIEVSRLATDYRFRSSDLLVGMFKYACSTCITPDRPWLIMSCMSKYIPFYEKIGLENTNVSYTDPNWNETLHVMIGDSYGSIKGENVHPVYWNIIWKDVCHFMIENGLVQLTTRDRARIFLYKLFSPLAAYAGRRL